MGPDFDADFDSDFGSGFEAGFEAGLDGAFDAVFVSVFVSVLDGAAVAGLPPPLVPVEPLLSDAFSLKNFPHALSTLAGSRW